MTYGNPSNPESMNMEGFGISPAIEEEIPRIALITSESWKSAYAGIIAEDYLASLTSAHWIDRLSGAFEDKTLNVLVAKKDGEIIGFTGFGKSRQEDYSNDGEIVSMYFLPEYIGKGYGHKLMTRVLQELTNLGFANAILATLAANKRAIGFYTSSGFAVEKTGLLLRIGNSDYEYLLMRKRLTQ